MTNRNRNSQATAQTATPTVTDVPNPISQEVLQMATQTPTQPATPTAKPEEGSATATATAKPNQEEKLTSFNCTVAVLRRLPEEEGKPQQYKFVLSFRPTVRGSELFASMATAIKSHIAQPKTVEKTDDHILVADLGEPEVLTHWAIIRSDRRCPICGQPAQTPSDWCHSDFCDNARTAKPEEKKSRRVENPNAIDF